MFTASAITQVYDAVKKTSHKSKFESLPLDKIIYIYDHLENDEIIGNTMEKNNNENE